MGLFGRLFRKPIKPSISQRPSGLCGPVTLHEALAIVLPAANELDPKAGLTFVTSGLDIQQDGRSHTWEFSFILPNRSATLMLSLEPDAQSEDPDAAPSVLKQRVNPLSQMDSNRVFLPAQIRNSPEVVAELSSRGADFIAGPSDMKIESRILDSGGAVWVTYYFDQEFTTRFGDAK